MEVLVGITLLVLIFGGTTAIIILENKEAR